MRKLFLTLSALALPLAACNQEQDLSPESDSPVQEEDENTSQEPGDESPAGVSSDDSETESQDSTEEASED